MEVFNTIRNVQHSNNNYDKIELNNKNENKKVEEIQKEIDKKSKEEIKDELQKVVKELNEAMNPLNTDLEFKFNDKVDELTVLVVDKKNDKVIREFPPKDALKLMEKMRELVGMLFDKKG